MPDDLTPLERAVVLILIHSCPESLIYWETLGGLTQTQLAWLLGCTRQAVYSMEHHAMSKMRRKLPIGQSLTHYLDHD